DGTPASKKLSGNDIDKALKEADDLYNPPVVIEKWEELILDTAKDKPTDTTDESKQDTETKAETTQTATVTPVKTTSTAYAVRVPRSTELHALSDGRVLIRSGKVNRPLGGQEILRLASAKNTGDFESDIVPGATKDDFSRKMIDEYLEKRAERTKRPYNGKIDDLLVEIGALTSDGHPTVSGILL
ncbi:MAG: hypothetical protein CUN57_01080, partial [Phototrophicales bacterium]